MKVRKAAANQSRNLCRSWAPCPVKTLANNSRLRLPTELGAAISVGECYENVSGADVGQKPIGHVGGQTRIWRLKFVETGSGNAKTQSAALQNR